jgi:hypothetical protein
MENFILERGNEEVDRLTSYIQKYRKDNNYIEIICKDIEEELTVSNNPMSLANSYMDELCRQRFESYYKKLYDEVFKVINRFWMNQYIKNMQLTDEIVAIFASEQNNFLNVLGNKLQSGEFVAIKSRKNRRCQPWQQQPKNTTFSKMSRECFCKNYVLTTTERTRSNLSG